MAAAGEAGWEVVGTSRTDPAWQRLEVRDAAGVDALVSRVRPDAVVHTAYVQSGPDLDAITATGAAHVALAASRAGARLVHLSTDFVFDGAAGRPYVEADPLSPVTAYGRAKAAAERLVAGADPRAAIVRTSLIWGGGVDGGPHLRSVTEVARGEREMAFFSDELRCPVHVSDLAAAILELLDVSHAGPIHLAGADGVSRLEFARLVVADRGLDASRLHGDRSAGRAERRPLDCRLDSSLAAGLLRTRLRGVRELLAGG